MPKNGPFRRVFRKPEACGQTVLPDKKWWKMPKYEKFKCNILSNFQTLWLGSQQLGVTTNHHPFSLSFVALLLINVAQSHNTLLLSTFMAKDNENCVCQFGQLYANIFINATMHIDQENLNPFKKSTQIYSQLLKVRMKSGCP